MDIGVSGATGSSGRPSDEDDDDGGSDDDFEYIATLPSGAPFGVLTEEEGDFLAERAQSYMTQFKFETATDLADLDQVVRTEMLLWRWDQWLSTGTRYGRGKVDIRSLAGTIKDRATELRGLKKSMGIDKVTRDRTSGEGSPAQKMDSILKRAALLGVHRVHQLDTALELTHQLISLVETHDRCESDTERRDVGVLADDIWDWIRDVYIPEFRAIDAYFLEHEQRYWEAD